MPQTTTCLTYNTLKKIIYQTQFAKFVNLIVMKTVVNKYTNFLVVVSIKKLINNK